MKYRIGFIVQEVEYQSCFEMASYSLLGDVKTGNE